MKKLLTPLFLFTILVINFSCQKKDIAKTETTLTNEDAKAKESVKKLESFFTQIKNPKKTRSGEKFITSSDNDMVENLEFLLNYKLSNYKISNSTLTSTTFNIQLNKSPEGYDINDLLTFLNTTRDAILNFKNGIVNNRPVDNIQYIDLEFTSQSSSIGNVRVVAAFGTPHYDPIPLHGPYNYRYYPAYEYYNAANPIPIDVNTVGLCQSPLLGNRVSTIQNDNVGDMTIWGRTNYLNYANLNQVQLPFIWTNISTVTLEPKPTNDNIYRPQMAKDMWQGPVSYCIGIDEINYYMNKSNPKISDKLNFNQQSYVDHYWTYGGPIFETIVHVQGGNTTGTTGPIFSYSQNGTNYDKIVLTMGTKIPTELPNELSDIKNWWN